MLCSDCSKIVKPVVAFDIDGTLGAYHAHFIAFCQVYFGRNFPGAPAYDGSVDFEEFLGLAQHDYREAKLAYRQGGTKRWMPIFPGAQELVNTTHHSGVEVWIATTRPWQRLDNIDPDTREWLRRNDIWYDGLLYGDNKYEQLIEHVEPDRILAVVDDLPEQVVRANVLGLPGVHIHAPHNAYARQSPGYTDYADINYLIQSRLRDWKERNGISA